MSDAPPPADALALLHNIKDETDVSEQDKERAVLHALFTGSTRAGAKLIGVSLRSVQRWIKAFPFNQEMAERIMAMRAHSTAEAWAAEMNAIALLRRGIAKYTQAEADSGTPTSLADLEMLGRTAQRVASILALLGELELRVRLVTPTSDADLEGMKDNELLALAARLETERTARDVEPGDADAVDVEGLIRRDAAAPADD